MNPTAVCNCGEVWEILPDPEKPDDATRPPPELPHLPRYRPAPRRAPATGQRRHPFRRAGLRARAGDGSAANGGGLV